MRAYTGLAVLTFALAGADTASAAWDNAFQTSCNCRPRTSYYGDCPAPCPAPCPTISYQQRCYYCPYTAYRQETYYEPVTTYRTSYYWEPVTSYRYTSYYDPCTGCCNKVATPCTSYRLRSQCNAVQSYVQRCQMVPYTAYRQSCYMEPVVSYSAPTCPTTGPLPGVREGGATDPERKPLPGVSEGPEKNLPPQNLQNGRNRLPPSNDTQFRGDRVASNASGRLQGTIVSDDRITPKGGAQVIFASANKQASRISAQADRTGRFAVELPAGEWTMYLAGNDGKPVYHSEINVKGNDQRLVTVVSR